MRNEQKIKIKIEKNSDAGNSSKTKGSAMSMQQIVAKQVVSAVDAGNHSVCYYLAIPIGIPIRSSQRREQRRAGWVKDYSESICVNESSFYAL